MNYLSVLFLVFLFFHGYAQAFDYWKISQFWPRGLCHRNPLCVKPKLLEEFTIHGLWPSNWKGPPSCTQQKFNPSLVRFLFLNNNAHLQQVWPSYYANGDVKFWAYEWEKHGTCSNLQQFDFFTLSIDIYERNNLTDILKNAGIVNGKTYNTNIISLAIGRALHVEPQLICKSTSKSTVSILTEIRICLDKSRIPQYINCSLPSGRATCANSIDFI
ncbi:hypothetical protein PHAVU_004G050200 [Phaseolus vulgaris]|uniref:Uncharacterized protein n=1 Tax=Phaseolus vulgaris TaxID=3885 RepID=V7BZZ5_PHAVU|nr:hypothetical protein PHAVU_004G050200g [Phaseolus vulgaris]ESW23474.1 hypothetical protein PHAVU_004G050200g [Phaseolus vulgaris]